MWARAFVGVGEDAGRLEDDVDAEVAPRQCRRVPLGQDPDLAAVDDDRAVAGLDLAVIGAIRRVVLEQQGVHLGIDEVVDGDDLHVRRALDERLERLAADTAEAVDADADCHRGTSWRSEPDRGSECGCGRSIGRRRERVIRARGVRLDGSPPADSEANGRCRCRGRGAGRAGDMERPPPLPARAVR